MIQEDDSGWLWQSMQHIREGNELAFNLGQSLWGYTQQCPVRLWGDYWQEAMRDCKAAN